jgi:hypothetical protein
MKHQQSFGIAIAILIYGIGCTLGFNNEKIPAIIVLAVFMFFLGKTFYNEMQTGVI